MEENPGSGTANIGRNKSMAKLLMKILEGKRENRDLPNNKPDFFFKQRRLRYWRIISNMEPTWFELKTLR